MGLITVEGIKIYAYHGHLPEEAVLGGHFLVNVYVNANTDLVEESDRLEDTVDYVQIIEIVKKKMNIRSQMIEQPARRIVDALLVLKHVQDVKVELEKILPPIDACFNKISVTIDGKN